MLRQHFYIALYCSLIFSSFFLLLLSFFRLANFAGNNVTTTPLNSKPCGFKCSEQMNVLVGAEILTVPIQLIGIHCFSQSIFRANNKQISLKQRKNNNTKKNQNLKFKNIEIVSINTYLNNTIHTFRNVSVHTKWCMCFECVCF